MGIPKNVCGLIKPLNIVSFFTSPPDRLHYGMSSFIRHLIIARVSRGVTVHKDLLIDFTPLPISFSRSCNCTQHDKGYDQHGDAGGVSKSRHDDHRIRQKTHAIAVNLPTIN